MKKPIVFVCCFLLFCASAFGQDTRLIDSFNQVLQTTTDPTVEFAAAAALWEAYINHDLAAAAGQAERIVRLGRETQADSILRFGYEKLGVTYAYQGRFDSSGLYFRRALRAYEAADDYAGAASVLRNLGQDHAMMGELDSAAHYYRAAGARYAQIADSVGMADIYNSEAVLHYARGFYNLAFDRAVAGEEIFLRRPELAQELNQNRMVIASIYAAMKDTVNAIEYFEKTLDFFVDNQLPRQYIATGIMLADLQLPDHAAYPGLEKMIDRVLTYAETLGDPDLIGQGQAILAALAYYRGDYAAARARQERLVAQSKEEGTEVRYAQSLEALGRTLVAAEAYPAAIDHLRTAERLGAQLGLEDLERNAKRLLAQAYAASGDYRNGLTYFKAYKELDEKIYNAERVNRFNELQTIYETEKKENALALQAEEIKTLNAQARSNRLLRTLYASGMLSFVLISGLLYFGFRQRIKRQRTERERQAAAFRQEIAFKKKELTSQTLHMVQKNTFLSELRDKLSAIRQTPELFKTEFRKITTLLDRQVDEDATWEVFKSYFSQVHDTFEHRLRAVAAELTENDIRLASFLRMNLTTKEIASLLNVLPDSVLKSKYRLKKKMGLDKEQELSAYLSGL